MKKVTIILIFAIFITNVSFAQKLFPQTFEMNVGDQIEMKDILNKKGKVIGTQFYQGENLLNYNLMYKTLKGIDACDENTAKIKKLRTGRIIMTVVGLITFPMGYLILIGPIIGNGKKEVRYMILAVEDYNKTLN
jgi:hypothetical protein